MQVNRLSFISALMLAFATRAGAESAAAVRAGWTAPTSDLRRAVGEGFHVGVSATMPSEKRDVLGLDVTYHRFAEKRSREYVFGFPVDSRQKLSIVEGMLFLRVRVVPEHFPAKPYLKLGLGGEYLFPDVVVEAFGGATESTQSKFEAGEVAGAGIAFPLANGTGLGLEALVHRIENSSQPSYFYTVSMTYGLGARH